MGLIETEYSKEQNELSDLMQAAWQYVVVTGAQFASRAAVVVSITNEAGVTHHYTETFVDQARLTPESRDRLRIRRQIESRIVEIVDEFVFIPHERLIKETVRQLSVSKKIRKAVEVDVREAIAYLVATLRLHTHNNSRGHPEPGPFYENGVLAAITGTDLDVPKFLHRVPVPGDNEEEGEQVVGGHDITG